MKGLSQNKKVLRHLESGKGLTSFGKHAEYTLINE